MLSERAATAGVLKRQLHVGQQVLDGSEQTGDRMASGGAAQVLGRHVQIDLRAGDLSMPEQVADGDEADAGAHQVRGERVAQAMR